MVRSGTQRQGYFQQLGAEIYAEAAAAGWQFSTGVCNDKSIGAVVKYMGWKTPGPLPVKLCPPLHTGRGVVSERVDAAFRAGARFAEVTAGLDDFPGPAVDELVHDRVPALAARVPAAPSTRCTSNDELVGDHHHTTSASVCGPR